MMTADGPDLFTTFWHLAHLTWQRRGTAKKLDMYFSEETISETLLLELAIRNQTEITILPFNKREEGLNGADWEWCFLDPVTRTNQRMLVQAKLLDDKDQVYSHIDRFIGSSGIRQIDRLMENSRNREIPALYVFYNHLNDPGRLPQRSACRACVECWGCSVALAEAVAANLASSSSPMKSKSFEEIKLLSQPWLCLLCECEQQSGPLPQRVLQSLRKLRDLAQNAEVDSALPLLPDTPTSQPPPYFDLLSRLRLMDSPQERERIIRSIRLENPNLDGIVLISENSE